MRSDFENIFLVVPKVNTCIILSSWIFACEWKGSDMMTFPRDTIHLIPDPGD